MNMERLRPCKRKIDDDDERRRENIRCEEVMEQVLVEILIRLPTKSAFRCKAVCKLWKSTISSDYFAGLFNSRYRDGTNSASSGYYTLVSQWKLTSCLTGTKKYYNHAISTDPLLFRTRNWRRIRSLDFSRILLCANPRPEVIKLEASCNDLLLCKCHCSGTYYAVNPLTRQWNVIPPPPCYSRGKKYRTGFLCLDGNSSTSSFRFKVIRIPVFRSHEFEVQIFCSQSRKWTNFVVDWYPIIPTHCYLIKTPIISHNGMLHWLTGRSLVSFDPFLVGNSNSNSNRSSDGHELKLSRTLDMPKDLPLGAILMIGFGVCQGLLRVISQSEEGPRQRVLEVWELDEGVGEWHLVHKLLLAQLSRKIFTRERFLFIAFHPYDRDIVYVKIANTIYGLNMETGKSGSYKLLQPYRYYRPLAKAVPPLLHQWFPTQLPSSQSNSSSASASASASP